MQDESQNIEYKRMSSFIESWGRGINKIKTEFVENGLEAPVYKEEMGGMSVYITRKKGLYGEDDGVNDGVNDHVKVIENKDITRNDDHINDGVNDHINDGANDGVKWSKNEKYILALMSNNSSITYNELQEVLKISEPTVRRAIKKLRTNKMLVREGSDKSGYWYITEKGKQLIKKQK